MSFNNLPTGNLRLNLASTLYHDLSLAALLDTFPPSFLKIGGTARILKFYHGGVKTAADVETISGLNRIDRTLTSFKI